MMSESSCGYCGSENPQGVRVCDNCGMPLSEAAPPREVDLPREAVADTRSQEPPSPPSEEPISFSVPTQEAGQDEAPQDSPADIAPEESTETTRTGWRPTWLNLPVTVIAGVVVMLAVSFVYGSVRAGALDALDLTKALKGKGNDAPQEESETAKAAPTEDPETTSDPPSPSLLSSFLPSLVSSPPPDSESLSPPAPYAPGLQAAPAAPIAASGIGGTGCQEETGADDFAQALEFRDATSLAEYLGLEGGKDELARVLRSCSDVEDLATSLGFSNAESLAEYLGFDDQRELARSLRVSGELGKLAETLGFDSTEELADRLGVDRRDLLRGFRDSENSEELAESLGFSGTAELTDRLGVDEDTLSSALEPETTDNGDSSTATFAAPAEGELTAGEDPPASKTGASGNEPSTTTDEGKAANNIDESQTEEAVGVDETPAPPKTGTPPQGPPPPPAQVPPAAPEVTSLPLNASEPAMDPASSPPASQPPAGEPVQELTSSGA